MSFDLTVCIPTLNGSDTIQKTIKSVNTQGVEAKIIIADNGSVDGTKEMLETAVKNGWYGTQTIELHKAERVKGGRPENIAHIRK